MKQLGKVLLGAVLCTSALAGTAATASAAIVCSGGDCWHARTVYEYPATAHVIIHDDSWRWGDGDHFRWREHEGRGFWHGDAWEGF